MKPLLRVLSALVFPLMFFLIGCMSAEEDSVPTAPSGLWASAVSSSQIDLRWNDNSNNEDRFRIERKTGAGGAYAQIAQTAVGATSYQNTGLTPNTLYFYRVCAFNSGGNSSYSNEILARTNQVLPLAPSYLQAHASAISSSQIDLQWTDNSDNEDGFRIERKTGAGGAWFQIAQTASDVISYQNTGITPDTTYYHRVRAFNSVGNLAYSNETSTTTMDDPPTAPSDLRAFTVTSSRIDLQWSDNSNNEDGFRIERKTGAGGSYAQIAQTAARSTWFRNEGLTPNTLYYSRVRAFNISDVNSAYSNEASATTSQVLPIAPSHLEAEAVSLSQINLRWNDNSNNEDGFRIERKTGAGGAYSQIVQTAAGATSYQNTGLTPNTLYYYRVYAFNAGGNSGYSNEIPATTSLTPPVAPSGLSASAVSSSQIDLQWNDNSSNEDGFRIERKTDAGGAWSQIAQTAEGATSYQNTGRRVNTTYFYRVCAFNFRGSSGYSNEASATTIPSLPLAPSGLSASAVSSSQIDLQWTDNSDNEDGFRIQRTAYGGIVWSQIAQTAAGATSYQNTGLPANTTYTYRVYAFNGIGNSGYSNEASATTR